MMHDTDWTFLTDCDRSRAENQAECNLLFAGIRARIEAMNHPPHSTDHLHDPEFWRRRQTGEDLSDSIVAELEPEPVKRRQRKPTLASLKRQAARAGIEVARYDFRPDGTISVVVGKPVDGIEMDDATPIDRSEWN